jgi:hypothetical protein
VWWISKAARIPRPPRRSAYLNRPGAIRHLYNAGDAGQHSVLLCEEIPDTLPVLVAGIKDTGACGLYGTGGWQPAWLPLFRRASRVYVALDRDAIDRAIALARTFGARGRVLIPPEDLGPKGDLSDWLRVGAKGDPGRVPIHFGVGPRGESHAGRSRFSGYHRTSRRGIWRIMPTCAISCGSWAIKDHSAAMRICDYWRCGLEWCSSLFKRLQEAAREC